jgi:hypothetical protein
MCRVAIPIMQRPTMHTRPHSYAQVTQSARTCLCQTGRASNRGPRLIDVIHGHAKPFGFVGKRGPKLAPSGIKYGFGQARLDQFDAGDIADIERLRTTHNVGCRFVCPIVAAISNLRMESGDTFFLVRSLGHRQRLFMLPGQVLSGIDHPVRARRLVFQPQVDADLRLPNGDPRVGNLALEIDVPPASGILRKTAGLDLAAQLSGLPEPQTFALVRNVVQLLTDTPPLERYPAERLFTAPPLQTNLFELPPFLDVLLADFTERIRVQSQFMTSSRREGNQLEGRDKALLTPPRQQRDLIAVVPDGIDRPAHALQMCATGGVLDTVAIRQHRQYFTPSRLAFSRIISSSIALMFTPEVVASARKRRLASVVRRMLLACLVSMTQLYINMRHFTDPGCHLQWQRAFLPPLKRGVSCTDF